MPPGIYSLCHSYRALGLAHYEDRQGDRCGCICVTGVGAAAPASALLNWFPSFPTVLITSLFMLPRAHFQSFCRPSERAMEQPRNGLILSSPWAEAEVLFSVSLDPEQSTFHPVPLQCSLMEKEVSMKWTAKTYEYFRGKSQGTPLNPVQFLQMELGVGVLLNEKLQRCVTT